MFQRYTVNALQDIFNAEEEAKITKQPFIGSSHLLIGLIKNRNSMISKVLKDKGLTIEKVRKEIDKIIFKGSNYSEGKLPLGKECESLLDLAFKICSNKGFDIPHPNKEGYRLRHICVEGPEDGPIYIRGKLNGNDDISLPDYWRGLVDTDSITVHLTPYGSHQELFVDEIKWGKTIIVRNNAGGPIKCYYQVWANRLADEKLHVEYEGESPADYPGDSSRFSIAGYDYDRRED